jgi:hypothetical protein
MNRFDYSAINLTELQKLKTYNLPNSYRLQENYGNGCYMDPPGYPTYFTQSVYTQTIDHPRVVAWIRECYLYFGGLYVPETGELEVVKLTHEGPPERYRPFVYVREFYPEHELDVELKRNRPKHREGDW